MKISKVVKEFLKQPSYKLLCQIESQCITFEWMGYKLAKLLFIELIKHKYISYPNCDDNANIIRDNIVNHIMNKNKMNELNIINLNNIKLKYVAERLYKLYNGVKRFILALIMNDVRKVKKTWDILLTTGNYKMALHNVKIYDDLMYNKEIYRFLKLQGFNIDYTRVKSTELIGSIECTICFEEFDNEDIINHGCCMNYCISCASKMPNNKCPCKQDVIETDMIRKPILERKPFPRMINIPTTNDSDYNPFIQGPIDPIVNPFNIASRMEFMVSGRLSIDRIPELIDHHTAVMNRIAIYNPFW